MMRWLGPVVRDLGLLLHVPALMGIPALFVSSLSGEWDILIGFAVMMLLSAGIGQGLYRCAPSAGWTLPVFSMITASLAWLGIALLVSVPFYVSAHTSAWAGEGMHGFRDFCNAFFEGMSGITSTGLTVAVDARLLPHGLQWWRSSLEWVGGVGVIVLALALFRPVENGYALYSAEAREDRTGPNLRFTVRRIWWIYLIFTALAVFAFRLAGMPWWQAVNHGMTGVSTGGFTTTSDSFRSYSAPVKGVAMVVMMIGAVSFSTHYAWLFQRRWRTAGRDTQLRALGVLLVIGGVLLVGVRMLLDNPCRLLDTLFQWSSALGTCGFSAAALDGWASPALLLLVIGMFIGGASGSTTGGIKLRRAALLFKAVIWWIRAQWPRGDRGLRCRLDGQQLKEQEAIRRIHMASVLLLLFLVTLTIGTFSLLLVVGEEHTFDQVLFEAASALGSVGLSTGVTGPHLAWSAKLILIGLMWMGRLEILSVLVLIAAPISAFRSRSVLAHWAQHMDRS
jgi:trk system potassium uptake protein TrkH